MDEKTSALLKSNNPTERKKAVIALGNSKDRDALKILGEIYKTDPDEAVREVALKAGRYIQRETQNMPVLNTSELNPPESIESVESVDIKKAAEAQAHFHEAVGAQLRKDKARAIVELATAIQINPALAKDENFAKFASDVTGKPAADTIKLLRDPALQEDIKKLAKQLEKREEQKKQVETKKSRNSLFIVLAVVGVVLLVLAIILAVTGVFSMVRYTVEAAQIRGEPHTLPGGEEYFLVVPGGKAPEGGWAVVVVFPTYGSGADMVITEFVEMAHEENAIFIMPSYANSLLTFETFDPFVDANAVVNEAVQDVRQDYPISNKGAVLYGFSTGAMDALGYYTYHSDRVSAVVAEGALFIPETQPGTYYRPLYILYGQFDMNAGFNQAAVQDLKDRGHNVTYKQVSGKGHQMTDEGMDYLRESIQAVYES